MTLREQQSRFMRMLARLLLFIYDCGYEVTGGDLWAKSGHAKDSFHYKRLAIDLNLFKDGVWLKETEDHRHFGEFWEDIGGTWGGHFKNKDGNHYSLGEGRKDE